MTTTVWDETDRLEEAGCFGSVARIRASGYDWRVVREELVATGLLRWSEATTAEVAALALAIVAAGCSEPVVAPVVVAPVAPAPVVERRRPVEREPAAWRCVREGRCAAPVDVDGGILGR